MKTLGMLALALGTLTVGTLGAAPPAAASDDAFVGVRVGPLRLGLGVDDDHRYRRHHHYDDGYHSGYRDCDDCRDGSHAHRDEYVPRYDRRYSPDPWPAYWSYYGYRDYDDGNYAWYRRHHHHHHHDRDWDDRW